MKTDILLDTHVFLWLMNGDETLKPETRKLIQSTCKENNLLLSAISIWEIALLLKKERISLTQPLPQWIDKAKALSFLKIIPLDADIALESCALPGDFHGDPADRMIVATSRIFNSPLMTRDKKIIEYAHKPYLKVIAC